MRVRAGDRAHLSYCTNIHPGESWADVRDVLQTHVPQVKARVCPDAPFGVGLRLSGRAAAELESPGPLAELRSILDDAGLYVFTLNGFPHGSFHGTRVKEQVYRPDWLEDERLEYTDRLARLLAAITPEDADYQPSISSVPIGFRPRITGRTALENAADRVLRHAVLLDSLRRETGRTITLALEPEPCCRLETTAEAVEFFETFLLSESALAHVVDLGGGDSAAAESLVRRHVGVCLDTCHAAVEFEEPRESLALLAGAGISVFKAQLTTGLRIEDVDAEAREALAGFADDVYLHQVVERAGSQLTRYLDLPEAFASAEGRETTPTEWRVHFHVPLFLRNLGRFRNTQEVLADFVEAWKERPFTDHLEVETYTWDLLPDDYRNEPVVDAIAREIAWVRERIVS